MREHMARLASALTLAHEVRALREKLQRLNVERARVLRERADILSRFPTLSGTGGLKIHVLLNQAARWERLGGQFSPRFVGAD